MKIVVASGKGGVGKSMLASSLVLLFSKEGKVVACDCDVDAPNLGLWLGVTEYDKREKISTSKKARIIDQSKCDKKILDVCRFGAIEKIDGRYKINSMLCEGCGACKVLYPNAVELKLVKNGEIRVKKTKYGFLICAQLYPGETGSGKIVEELKRRAESYCENCNVIIDAAAGIGCPVITSVRGANFAVLVTEPTPSGFSDLKRILEIVDHFQIPYSIVINKWNINPNMAKEIEDWCGEKFLGKLSYDKTVIDSIVNLQPVLYSSSKIVEEIKKVFKNLKNEI